MAIPPDAFFGGGIYSTLSLDKTDFDSKIKGSQKQTKTLGDKIQQNKGKIMAMGAAMTVAGGLIVAGLSKAIKTATSLGDTFNKMSIRTGVSVKMLSSLKFAAEQAGANLEIVEKGATRLSKNMFDATLGLAEAKRGFAALGISVTDNAGKLRETDVIFLEIAEKFKGMKDGAEKAAIAQTLFGRSGVKLIPLLNQGKDGIEALSAEAEKLGIVFTEEAAQGAADLTDAGNAMDKSLQGVAITIGQTMQPIMLSLTDTITGIVIGVTAWMKEHPELTKAIVITTAALGALMVVVGPLLIALPLMASGFAMMKAKIIGIAPIIGKIAAAGAAFYVGWQVGKAIDDFLGLSKAIQKGFDALMPSQEFYDKLSQMKMGFTDTAKQSLFLRDSLIDVGKKLDENVTDMRSAAAAIRDNEAAYKNLHPRLQRIVDGFTTFRTAITTTSDELGKLPEQTDENLKAIEGIREASKIRIEELTLSETNFKIAQLDREFLKNQEILTANNARKSEMLILERQYSLDVQKIRDEAHKVRKEKEKAQRIEEMKQLEIIIKEQEEEIEREEARQAAHQEFLAGLVKQQQDIMLQNITERDGWRAGEIARIDVWQSEQLSLAQTRFENEKISFQQLQDEKIAINQLGSDKREQIDNEARDRQEEADKNFNKRMMSEYNRIVNEKKRKLGQYFDFARNITTIFSAFRDEKLQSWYDQELQRINESGLSNEARTAAIEELDTRMHQKKAALESRAQKREKAIAIAQAFANMYVGITAALKLLPPWNVIQIAFVTAAGLAAIAKIRSAYGGGGGGGGGGAGGGGGGGETVGTGGGGGGGGTGGGGKAGREVAAFQTGTQGFITPPSDFLVGEPLSTELVRIRGDRSQVSMAVTPLGNQQPASQGITFNITIPVTAIDAANFKSKIHNEIIPELQEALYAGLFWVPRGRVR